MLEYDQEDFPATALNSDSSDHFSKHLPEPFCAIFPSQWTGTSSICYGSRHDMNNAKKEGNEHQNQSLNSLNYCNSTHD